MNKKPEPFKFPPDHNLNTEEKRTDYTNKIGDALMLLTHVLGDQNMTLTAIDLGSWEDGQELRMSLDKQHAMSVELGIDHRTGEMVNQVVVAGVIVRWPTKRKALPDNSFKYI